MNLVLDLDESLIHSVTEKPIGIKKSSYFSFEIYGTTYYVIKRPGIKELFCYIFKTFDTVSIWTAATKEYAERVIENIFTKAQVKKLYLKKFRTHLVKGDKVLDTIFESNKSFNKSNTLLIDDKPYVTGKNYGNTIVIPEFLGDSEDDYIYKLIIILQGFMDHGLSSGWDEPLFLADVTDRK